MNCCSTSAADQQFDTRVAERDLRRFQRKGLDAPTRVLVDAVQGRALPPRPSLLDVGGGIGAIHHVLLEHGFGEATQVDASAAYLAVATEETRRIGHAGRVHFQHADFSAVAKGLPVADVVTLHRVVCCDPDFAGILGAAADRARRVVAFSYPRPRWMTRAFVGLTNWLRRAFSHGFQVHVHPPAEMAAVLERSGLRRSWSGGTWIWAVELFERAA